MTGRILHTMLRVGDLERSITFYTEKLGMQMIRREEYPGGQFTLAFVGYGNEKGNSTIELTYNWGSNTYSHGSAFGHIAIAVLDIHAACKRLAELNVKVIRAPGPMNVKSPDRKDTEIIAFIEDPDGYRIELIETKN